MEEIRYALSNGLTFVVVRVEPSPEVARMMGVFVVPVRVTRDVSGVPLGRILGSIGCEFFVTDAPV
jgi:hypothetical protein